MAADGLADPGGWTAEADSNRARWSRTGRRGFPMPRRCGRTFRPYLSRPDRREEPATRRVAGGVSRLASRSGFCFGSGEERGPATTPWPLGQSTSSCVASMAGPVQESISWRLR
jgi:hypothetical protein